jgi:hypothetical protein
MNIKSKTKGRLAFCRFIQEHPEIYDIVEEELNKIDRREPELLPSTHRKQFPDMTDKEICLLSRVSPDIDRLE